MHKIVKVDGWRKSEKFVKLHFTEIFNFHDIQFFKLKTVKKVF